ncbi:hypothetical protein BDP27DRAFT_350870 [Rhodocollybia butyracea]|uniref:Uncharacterized protein n=1 Tax=Rhodocollybia butyracea TaxID=206335 RepID=A0A9P5UGC5_9AGAR|nr:hypothetical protein BDP27DRAFT_350870 [Rhodocollybia butyracea]
MSHSPFDAYPILLQSCGLLHFLCLSVLLELDNRSMTIRLIRLLLDVSWSDLRSIISCLRSIIGEDEKRLAGLCDYIQDRPLAGESFPWPSLSRDLARRCIQIGKDIHAGKLEDVSWGEIQFHTNWAIHVRLSPCCNELLHDIQSLHPSQLPQCNVEDIHHVLEWLQSFPDPPFEVITCWAQHLVEIQVTNGRNFNPDNAERAWKNHLDRVKKRREITIKLKRVSTNNMRDTMVASVAGQI